MADAAERRERLVEVFRDASECTLCPLAATRTKVVFGAGNANADLMFVGEAPGAEEDRQGLPFVGRAGGLLNQLLGEIELTREDVMVVNVLKCRPPGNRDPQPAEIESCRPYLEKQVELIEPRVIATLGNFATKLLTASPTGITKVRGTPQLKELGGRTVFLLPLFHPAAALRTPSLVETLHDDFRSIPALLERDPAAMAPAGDVDRQPPSAGDREPVRPGAEIAAARAADQLGLFG
jgi:uracil-DNA glycosylase family 4